jgi:inosine triphosphate pyrophosphatase
MTLITFATGNDKKYVESKAILPASVNLQKQHIDLLEIQGSRHEIAVFKCKIAAEHVKGPVITEDTSLGFNAFKQLPGPYIKHFLEAIDPAGLYNMLSAFEDKSATAYCTVAYWNPELMKEPVVFEGHVDGTVVYPRGPQNFGWDPIFMPIGKSITFAEMTKEEKNSISHRCRAFEKLSKYLEKEAELN